MITIARPESVTNNRKQYLPKFVIEARQICQTHQGLKVLHTISLCVQQADQWSHNLINLHVKYTV